MLDLFRYFALVAQHGTLTAAARHAHVSQPALTSAIQRLEQQMGAKLLYRGAGGASLTAAGEALLPKARAALAAAEDGRRAVAEIMGLHIGSVRLGAGATVCTYYLPRILAKFRGRHPGVQIRVREAQTDEMLEALEAGDLDLAVVPSDVGEPWGKDVVILVGAPGVSARTAPFVAFARGAATRELLDRHFPDREIAMELGSIAAVKGNVRAGVGIALVSLRAVERDLAAGQLVEIPHAATPILRNLSIVHRGLDRLPPAAAALRRLLLDHRPVTPPLRKKNAKS